MGTTDTMVSNFIKKYGIDGLTKIIGMFQDHIPNPKIASEFNVSRQRVHQWQKAFTLNQVKPSRAVSKALDN